MPEDTGNLSPMYKPAEMDSKLLIRLVGNTPAIDSIQAQGITAGHLRYIGAKLIDMARQMEAMEEAIEADRRKKMGIAMPGDGGISVGMFKLDGR